MEYSELLALKYLLKRISLEIVSVHFPIIHSHYTILQLTHEPKAFSSHPGSSRWYVCHPIIPALANEFNWIHKMSTTEFFSKRALFSVILYSTRCNPYRENTVVLLLSFQYTAKQFHENQLLAGLQFISVLVNNLSFLFWHVWMNIACGFLWAHSSLPKN